MGPVARIAAAVLAASLGAVLMPMAATQVAAAQSLEWSACTGRLLGDGGFECARLVVPMDRDDPAAGTFDLAVARHRSSGAPSERTGSLFVNPGGPGGSGLDILPTVWESLPPSIRARFDVVTWDPRGIGSTRPALRDCATPFPDRPETGAVDWAAVVRGFERTMRAANRACQQANAAFIEHMGTNEVVQDLDRLREAVGDDRLTYWGMSYGTRIGYVYALAFPDRVRAVILDGSIDPASTLLSLTEGGAGPDQAYGVFADAQPQAAAQWRELQAVLGERTVPLPGGQVLDRWVLADAIYGSVAQQGSYPGIATLIGFAHAAVLGTGSEQEAAAATLSPTVRVLRRLPNSNAGGAFATVNCLDYPGRPGLGRMVAAVRAQVRLAPDYGGSLSTMYATNCAGLSLTPDPVPLITGPGPDVPVLVLGATRDGSTVVEWTARMSRAFPQSRTVTYAGGQHVTWLFAESACVNRVADAYILSERLPAMDRACRNTVRPVPASASPAG